jgi:hypothetical protein
MKELFKAYEEARKANDEIEKAWAQDVDNEELEEQFDATYHTYITTYTALVRGIVEFTNGAIDSMTAKRMIATKHDELKSLIEQMA